MHSVFKNLVRAALAASLLSSIAHAQLLLSGRITGMFTDSPGTHDSIYNAPDGSYAYFKSGVPEHPWFPQTMVEFSQQSFTDIGPGLVADNIFKVTNGRNWLGTTADAAHFDLWVELTSPESHSSLLTPVSFTINNTPNGNTNIDDAYHVSSSPIAPFKIDNTMVQFKFTAPGSFSLHENTAGFVGTLWVNFTPVPEPSTYAFAGAGLLLGAALFRSMRRRSTTQLAAV
jgi:hypothetical protein